MVGDTAQQNKHMRYNLWVEQDGKCHYCKRPMDRDNGSRLSVTIDHKLPRARGGADSRDNIVGACLECNLEKANLTEQEFLALLYPAQSANDDDALYSLAGGDQMVRDGLKKLRKTLRGKINRMIRHGTPEDDPEITALRAKLEEATQQFQSAA